MTRSSWLWLGIPCIGLVMASSEVVASTTLWRTVQLPSHPINVISNGKSLWVCGVKEMIAESTDSGESWQPKHLNPTGAVLLTLGFASGELGYAAGTGGALLLTTDGGTTWKAVPGGTESIYNAAFADEKRGLIETATPVKFASDGGKTWNDIPLLKSDKDLAEFKFVLSMVVLDGDQMAFMLKEGPAQYYSQRIIETHNGGSTWKVVDIPSVTLTAFFSRNHEYWAFGTEVIEKEKPGGGHGVPLVMHSSDGEVWKHNPRPDAEIAACTPAGCLLGDGAGVDPFGSKPSYWTFPAEKLISTKWASEPGVVCTVSGSLRCAPTTAVEGLPSKTDSGSIPPVLMLRALGAPRPPSLLCISCPYEMIVVSDTLSGPQEIKLDLLIGTDGIVYEVKVLKAPNAEIGERFSTAAHEWVFEPPTIEGTSAQAHTQVRLRVQAIKSR